MKYANRLTDEELREVYGLFIDSDGKINELNITRDERSIGLKGYVEIPEFEEERLKEDPNKTMMADVQSKYVELTGKTSRSPKLMLNTVGEVLWKN